MEFTVIALCIAVAIFIALIAIKIYHKSRLEAKKSGIDRKSLRQSRREWDEAVKSSKNGSTNSR